LTREGSPTSLIVATGPNVTVNMILGLPFITQTKMVINTSYQVAKLCAFDMPPFPINFRCAMCTIPVIDDAAAAANAALHADIVKEIKKIKEHIYKKSDAFLLQEKTPGYVPGSILLSPKQAQAVEFNNPTSNSYVSIASIWSMIDPFSTFAEADTNNMSITNIPGSA
jgi:hypothetical protein